MVSTDSGWCNRCSGTASGSFARSRVIYNVLRADQNACVNRFVVLYLCKVHIVTGMK